MVLDKHDINIVDTSLSRSNVKIVAQTLHVLRGTSGFATHGTVRLISHPAP